VKTGELHWKERLSGSGHHASAAVADGRVYFTADDGTTFVVRAASEFEVLAKPYRRTDLAARVRAALAGLPAAAGAG